MRADLQEAKEKRDKEIRRLGNRALKEMRTDEWLKKLLTAGIGEKLLDDISPDVLESIGKNYARQARKAQKTADDCFLMAKVKRRKQESTAIESK